MTSAERSNAVVMSLLLLHCLMLPLLLCGGGGMFGSCLLCIT